MAVRCTSQMEQLRRAAKAEAERAKEAEDEAASLRARMEVPCL